MSSILSKLKRNSKLANADVLSNSQYYQEKSDAYIPTEIEMMNVALSGDANKGLSSGILMLAGESKHFKTGFMLECAKGFQNKYPDGVILFYDSEKGAPMKYFKTRNMNMDQILHCPIRNIEELKFDIVSQLKMCEEEKVKVMVMIDSIGMLPSTKEVQNAENENTAADMTRARELNSLFRIITPYVAFNDIPVVLINHAYDSMDGSHQKTISGGKKVYLAADDVWIIGRQRDGVANDIQGYWFTITVDKSRYVREGTKITIHSTFEKGINKHSGLFEEAREMGLIQANGAWFKIVDHETGELSPNRRRKEIDAMKDWFDTLLKTPEFKAHIEKKYLLG